MIAADLFRKRGPSEPCRRSPASAAYIMGQEDWLYRRPYRGATMAGAWERGEYHEGWVMEEYDRAELHTAARHGH